MNWLQWLMFVIEMVVVLFLCLLASMLFDEYLDKKERIRDYGNEDEE